MQNQTNSPRHDGLQSIPWGSTNQQGPPVNKTEYYVSEKPVLLEPEEKRIWGVRKNRFIVFMLLGLFAIGITIIAAVVSANRKTPSRYVSWMVFPNEQIGVETDIVIKGITARHRCITSVYLKQYISFRHINQAADPFCHSYCCTSVFAMRWQH